MEVLIGRYEVINALRSERHRCVPMRFAGEYHFPGGAKRQTDLGPLQTACRELHEEFGVGVMQAEAMGPPELAATLFCKARIRTDTPMRTARVHACKCRLRAHAQP